MLGASVIGCGGLRLTPVLARRWRSQCHDEVSQRSQKQKPRTAVAITTRMSVSRSVIAVPTVTRARRQFAQPVLMHRSQTPAKDADIWVFVRVTSIQALLERCDSRRQRVQVIR